MQLKDLSISKHNVREATKEDEGFQNLVTSIKKYNLINKLVLRPAKGDKYEVIAGGRRYLALLEIHDGDWDLPDDMYVTMPDLDDEQALLISLEENQQRCPLSAIALNKAALMLNRTGYKDKEVSWLLNITPHRLKRIYQLSQDLNRLPDNAKEELHKPLEQAKLNDLHIDKMHGLEDREVIKEVVDYIIDKESPPREVPSIIKAIEKTHELIDDPKDKKPAKADGAADEPAGPIEYVHKGELKLVEDKGKVTLTVEGKGEDKEVPLDHYLEYLRHPEKFRVTINFKMKVKPLD